MSTGLCLFCMGSFTRELLEVLTCSQFSGILFGLIYSLSALSGLTPSAFASPSALGNPQGWKLHCASLGAGANFHTITIQDSIKGIVWSTAHQCMRLCALMLWHPLPDNISSPRAYGSVSSCKKVNQCLTSPWAYVKGSLQLRYQTMSQRKHWCLYIRERALGNWITIPPHSIAFWKRSTTFLLILIWTVLMRQETSFLLLFSHVLSIIW